MAEFRSILLCLTLVSASCSDAATPALAHVDRVGPSTLEPGDVLVIEGRGFVEGRCIVTLKGRFKPDGIRDEEVKRVSVNGTAVSETRIEVPLTPRTLKKFIEEPTAFNGTVMVDFPISNSAVQIVAEKAGISMALRPGGLGVAPAARRLRLAEANLRDMGLRLARRLQVDGLVVAEVTLGSVAHIAGLSVGDRLLAVDGHAVVEHSDFSVVDPAEAHRVELVSMSGTIRETEIPPVLTGTPGKDELTAVVLSSLALGLFLAFAAPSRRGTKRPLIGVADPLSQAVGVGVVSVPLAVIPAVSVLALGGVPLLMFLFAVQGVGLAMLIFLDTGRGVFSSVSRLLVVPLVVAVAGFLSSAVGLSDIVAGQQNTPYGPHVFANPFSFLLSAVSIALLWPVRGGNGGRRLDGWRFIATWASAAAGAAVVSLALLGGWNIPFVAADRIYSEPTMLIFGSLLFLIKTWLVILAARWFAASHLAERRRAVRVSDVPVLRTFLLLLGAGCTVAFQTVVVDGEMRVAGHVVAVALFVTFASTLSIVSVKEALRSFAKPVNTKRRHPLESETASEAV